MAGVKIGATSSYMGLDSWILANIIQLATFDFCRKFLNKNNDPAGRMFDQMTQAARSCQANIAEGSARHQTSVETEMKLLDVARASLSELAGDYMFILMCRDEAAWEQSDPQWQRIHKFNLDRPVYGKDFVHDAMQHIITQRHRLDEWLKNDDVSIVANTMIVLCTRVITMLKHQLSRRLDDFKEKGGFTENMTMTRLEAKKGAVVGAQSPRCPVCNAPMLLRVAKKGIRSGRQFWSCSNYPNCSGTRDFIEP